MNAAELYLLVSATVFPIVIMMMGTVWGVLTYLTPKASKTLTRASVFHNSLAMIWQPNHLIKLVQVKLMPEGYLVTKGKKAQRIPVARPIFEYIPSMGDESPKERKQMLQDSREMRQIEREAIRVSMFEGCRVPVFAVYSGVALAVNAETMVSLDSENSFRKVWSGAFGEDYEETLKQFQSSPLMSNGGNPSAVEKVKDVLVKIFLPINPEGIKRHLAKLVDQTTIDGIHADGWQEGFEEGKAGKNEKMFLYMILALLGAGIAVMVMIKFS